MKFIIFIFINVEFIINNLFEIADLSSLKINFDFILF